jgi:hypothetical protein
LSRIAVARSLEVGGARIGTLLLSAVLVLTACNAGGEEEACGLLEDLPRRAAQARVEELEELAESAMGAETAKIRAIGDRIASNLNRRQALEALAPNLAIELIDSDLENLRQACRNLEEAAVTEGVR